MCVQKDANVSRLVSTVVFLRSVAGGLPCFLLLLSRSENPALVNRMAPQLL